MEESKASRHVLALVRDLFFGVRLEAMGKSLGHRVETVNGSAEFEARLSQETFDAALVDLSVGEEAAGAIRTAKAHGVRTIAFGSHKNYDAQEAARQAGSDVVLTNSQVASGRLAQELSAMLSALS